MHKYLIAGMVVALTSTGCFAAEEFYVVKDSEGRGCEITRDKPDAANMIGTKSYASRQDAKDAKRAAPECADTAQKGGGAQQ
jgi:hypothetical protein